MQCKSELFKNSFFPKTVIDWNHVEDSVVYETVNDFRKAVSPEIKYCSKLSAVAYMLKSPAT